MNKLFDSIVAIEKALLTETAESVTYAFICLREEVEKARGLMNSIRPLCEDDFEFQEIIDEAGVDQEILGLLDGGDRDRKVRIHLDDAVALVKGLSNIKQSKKEEVLKQIVAARSTLDGDRS